MLLQTKYLMSDLYLGYMRSYYNLIKKITIVKGSKEVFIQSRCTNYNKYMKSSVILVKSTKISQMLQHRACHITQQSHM